MKRALVLAVAFCAVLALGGSNSWAACGAPLPIGHALDGFMLCDDHVPVQAFIYEIGAAATDNSADIRIACRDSRTIGAADPGLGLDCTGLGAGIIGDGQVSIQTDAFINTWVGCPQPPGALAHRIAAVVVDGTGKSLILAVSGNDPGLSYAFEGAQPYDDASGAFIPPACGNSGRPKITSLTSAGGNFTIGLHQDVPPVFSDCDTGSLGKFLDTTAGGQFCVDSFSKSLSRGAFYTKTGPCTSGGTPTNARTDQWTRSTVSPDAAGNGVVVALAPTTGNCLYIGGSGTFPSSTNEILTGYVQVPPQGAASPRAEEVRVAKGQGKVDVSWVSRSEVNLAAYKVMVDKKGGLAEALTVSPNGGGGAASYQVSIDMKNVQGGKAIVVRAVLTDGTTVDAAPVSF